MVTQLSGAEWKKPFQISREFTSVLHLSVLPCSSLSLGPKNAAKRLKTRLGYLVSFLARPRFFVLIHYREHETG